MAGFSEHDLRAFLLGTLASETAAELNAKMMAVDETFEALNDAEDALIDDFVLGELNEEENDAFYEYSRRRPGLKERVRMRTVLFRALENHAQESAKLARAADDARSRSRTLRLLVAAFAGGALLAAILYFLHRIQPTPRNAAKSPAAATTPAAAPQHLPHTSGVAGTAEVFLPQLASLSMAQLMPLELHLNNASQIKLGLEITADEAAGGGTWSVTISEGNRTALTQDSLHAQRFGATALVSILVESQSLAPGSYTVTLSRANPSAVSTRWALRVLK